MPAVFNFDSKEVISSLGSDIKQGLSQNTAENRLRDFGINEINKKSSISGIKIFLRQFKSFIIYILVFALVVSLLTKEFLDTYTILAILILNACFGFFQEYKAEKSIEALQKLSSLKSRVLRSGQIIEIDSKYLVPGDIVILEEGDKVPADGRILESFSLSVLESSLTGESNSSSKHTGAIIGMPTLGDQKNMVFSGTLVTNGRGKFIVTSTGMKTELGKIANLIGDVKKEETPLQKNLNRFGKYIGYLIIGISVVIFIVGIIKDGIFTDLISGNYKEFLINSRTWLLTAVALAVAAVPEGLPAVVTVSLAIGVKRMLKKRSLIRRLPSVETLGATTVICCDKTGTLTKNEMTVKNIFINNKDYSVSGQGYNLNGTISLYGDKFIEKDNLILEIGASCNNAEFNHSSNVASITGDPTEVALLVSALKSGVDYKSLREIKRKINEIPFDSTKKMMSTLHKDGKNLIAYTKGAPERVLAKCTHILINNKSIKLSSSIKSELLSQNNTYARNALRVLGFAYKEIKNEKDFTEEDLTFVGFQAMIDPPKIEVSDYISKSKQAGIRVIMITGDNIYTANAIAKEIGLTGDSIEGSQFSQLGSIEKQKIISSINIFARVEPKHKLEIIQLLQQRGEVVAMTGDGVNDSPALKKADIGIAMGIKGTDVAQEASDMVLLDDNFSTIVSAVEEGRGIYKNITTFVNYLISSNIAEVLIILLSIIFGMPLPITAIMLLWINLVTDGLPALALSLDPYPQGLMNNPPRLKNEQLMGKGMMFEMIYVSVLITAGVLGVFTWALNSYPSDLKHAQTIAFTTIVLLELTRVYIIRAGSGINMFKNLWLMGAVSISFILQLIAVYGPLGNIFGTVPLSLFDWKSISLVFFFVSSLSILGVLIRKKLSKK